MAQRRGEPGFDGGGDWLFHALVMLLLATPLTGLTLGWLETRECMAGLALGSSLGLLGLLPDKPPRRRNERGELDGSGLP